MKRFTVLVMLGAMLLLSTSVYADHFISRHAVSASGSCAVGFEPDNVKQVISRFINATGTAATSALHVWRSSNRTTTDITASAAGNTAAMTDLYTAATTNWTAGDWLFIYIITGSNAGNYQIVKITTVSAGNGAILAAALTYTLPFGTYVYCMDTDLGPIAVGATTKEISNSGGWLAGPSASPLIFDLVSGGATGDSLNSVFCVYQS